MSRKTLPPARGKVQHPTLFVPAEVADAAPTAGDERSTRLRRQVSLLQHEYDRLAEENARLREAASLSSNGFCALDRHGMILAANDAFAAFVQTEARALQGIAFVSFLPDRFHQKFLSFIHHVRHAPGAHAMNVPLIAVTGAESAIRIDARSAARDGSTSVSCLITRLSANDRIEGPGGMHGADAFRTIAEYSRDVKMWFDQDGMLLWINKAVEALTGYSSHECFALPDFPSSLVDAGDRCVLNQAYAEALRGGEALDIEMQMFTKTGNRVFVELDFHPMFGADGAQYGFCVSVRSIAERKRMEMEAADAKRHLEKQVRERTSVLHRKNKALHEEVAWHIGMKDLLEASERKFRLLWERSLDGMKLVDEQGITVMVNDAFCTLAGMPREMLIGKPSTIVYAAEERSFFNMVNDRLTTEDASVVMLERQLRMWDDRVVWLELLASPFPGDEEKKFLLIIARDITSRKRIEEKNTLLNAALENRLNDRLAELDSMNIRLSAEMRERIDSEEWIRDFLHHCPIVMYIKDARACMLMANRNFETMFGMNPNSLIGKSNTEIWGPALGEVFDRQDFDVLKNTAPKEYLDTINDRAYLTMKFPIRRKDLPPLVCGYVQDVTDVLAEERAWKLSRQFFERILDALGDLVCVKDSSHRYVLVNDSFVEFTGIPREAIIGHTDRELFDEDVADMIASGDDAVLEKQREFLIEEFMSRKDGMQRRILVKKDIYFDEHDKPFIVNVLRDITELRKEEEEIRAALAREKELNELKSRFVSMVSHEYKTPLTAILSSAELLELFRKSWSEEKVNAHLQKIKRAVETMIEMISDALFLNKMETGRLTVNPNTFELVSFCIMIKDEIQACAPAQKAIEFSSTVTSALVSVDNKFLRYIFTNLLSNAVKYSFADTTIHFDVTIDGQKGVFRVENRGIGIPSDQRERLFEPFFRAPNTGTIPGTGLGLSIVKRCVDSLQGSISVESVENGPTTFTVALPLRVFEQHHDIIRRSRSIHTG